MTINHQDFCAPLVLTNFTKTFICARDCCIWTLACYEALCWRELHLRPHLHSKLKFNIDIVFSFIV